MLIFSRASLAFIAVPKTGTTSIEAALTPLADIVFSGQRKHIPARRFDRKIAPFLADTFNLRPERMAVLRDPVEQIGSWYRYRSRNWLKGSPRYTGDLSFDAFVRDVIRDDPPEHADIGSQFRMVAGDGGNVLVHHLFAHDQMALFQGFIQKRLDEKLTFEQLNRSPPGDIELDPGTLRRLRQVRRAEFDLFERIRQADGHLVTRLD